jgi:hypothetical protein
VTHKSGLAFLRHLPSPPYPATSYTRVVSGKANNNIFPMNTSQFTSLLAFILITHLTNGQENICVCGSYSTVYSDSKYESILPRNVIRKKQIKTLIIYTQASVRNKIVGPDKYKEVKFVFNSEGVITSQTLYFNGKPERIHEFERNGAGKVIKRTTSYLDILEQKEKGISPVQITDYSYDNKHRLIKIKDRGFNGNTLADSKSSLIKYEYDEKDRLKKTINQYYYEGENGPVTSIYSTNFKYCLSPLISCTNSEKQICTTKLGKDDKNKTNIYS